MVKIRRHSPARTFDKKSPAEMRNPPERSPKKAYIWRSWKAPSRGTFFYGRGASRLKCTMGKHGRWVRGMKHNFYLKRKKLTPLFSGYISRNKALISKGLMKAHNMVRDMKFPEKKLTDSKPVGFADKPRTSVQRIPPKKEGAMPKPGFGIKAPLSDAILEVRSFIGKNSPFSVKLAPGNAPDRIPKASFRGVTTKHPVIFNPKSSRTMVKRVSLHNASSANYSIPKKATQKISRTITEVGVAFKSAPDSKRKSGLPPNYQKAPSKAGIRFPKLNTLSVKPGSPPKRTLSVKPGSPPKRTLSVKQGISPETRTFSKRTSPGKSFEGRVPTRIPEAPSRQERFSEATPLYHLLARIRKKLPGLKVTTGSADPLSPR